MYSGTGTDQESIQHDCQRRHGLACGSISSPIAVGEHCQHRARSVLYLQLQSEILRTSQISQETLRRNDVRLTAQPFFVKHQAKSCPRLWSPALSLEPLLEPMRDLVQSPLENTGAFVTKQSADPLALFFIIFSPSRRTLSTVIRTRLPWRATSPYTFGN